MFVYSSLFRLQRFWRFASSNEWGIGDEHADGKGEEGSRCAVVPGRRGLWGSSKDRIELFIRNEKILTEDSEFWRISSHFFHFSAFLNEFGHFCTDPWNSDKISSKFSRKITKFIEICRNENEHEMKNFILAKKSEDFFLNFCGLSGAKDCKSCCSRKMLKNEHTLAIVAVHVAENEPPRIWWFSFHFSIHSLISKSFGLKEQSRSASVTFCFLHHQSSISLSSLTIH